MRGYIALISIIVISALLLSITFALNASGFFARFNILDSEAKERSLALAEACVELALLKLANNPSYGGGESLPVDGQNCLVKPISAPSSGEVMIQTQACLKNTVSSIQVVAESTELTITSWQEVASLPSSC